MNGASCRQWGLKTDRDLRAAPAAGKQFLSKPLNPLGGGE